MPHLPHQPTTPTGVAAEPPRAAHAPIPVRESPAAPMKMPGLDTIDMKRWDVKPSRVFKIMFGKEPTVDDATGQLVYPG